MRKKMTVVALLLAVAPTASALSRAPALSPACGSSPNETTCLGELDVPPAHRAKFIEAGRFAIDAVYSDGFANDLRTFVSMGGTRGRQAAAWQGLDADDIIRKLRHGMAGQGVTTYGGLGGWWSHTFFGNLARDGGTSGPVRVNRVGLNRRSAADVAGTIAHEVAHRIGLRHPSIETNWAVGVCEPAYVIGSLVKKHTLGNAWVRTVNDCALIAG